MKIEELEQEFAEYLLPTLASVTREHIGMSRRLIQSLIKCVFMEMEESEGVSERWQFSLRSGNAYKLKDAQMRMELRIFNRERRDELFNEREFAMMIFDGIPTLVNKTKLDKMGYQHRYDLNMEMIDLVIEYFHKVMKKCIEAYRTKETMKEQIDPFNADMPGFVINPSFIKRVKRLMYKDIIYSAIDGEWEDSDKGVARYIGRGDRNALVLKHLGSFIKVKKLYTILIPTIRLEIPNNQYLNVGDAILGFNLAYPDGENRISKSFNIHVSAPSPEWYLTKSWRYEYLTLMLALLLEVSEDAYENMRFGKEMKRVYNMEELKYGKEVVESM